LEEFFDQGGTIVDRCPIDRSPRHEFGKGIRARHSDGWNLLCWHADESTQHSREIRATTCRSRVEPTVVYPTPPAHRGTAKEPRERVGVGSEKWSSTRPIADVRQRPTPKRPVADIVSEQRR
jgi:hypothetical protein